MQAKNHRHTLQNRLCILKLTSWCITFNYLCTHLLQKLISCYIWKHYWIYLLHWYHDHDSYWLLKIYTWLIHSITQNPLFLIYQALHPIHINPYSEVYLLTFCSFIQKKFLEWNIVANNMNIISHNFFCNATKMLIIIVNLLGENLYLIFSTQY